MASSRTALGTAHDRRSARKQASQREQTARQRRMVMLAAGSIIVALALLVGWRVLLGTPAAPVGGPVSAATMAAIANIPASTFAAVGAGSAQVLPTPVRAPVRTGPQGLPLVTYIGAEYCPYCAAQRWALVVALSRFGEFNGLHLSHSAGDDIYPNTPTVTFVGATYESPYLEFSSVELQSNQRQGSSYAPLQTPTPEQQQLLRLYDAPPYVSASSAGAIPFVDLADQYVITGSSFDVGVLRGQTDAAIAQALSDPNSPTARAIIGSANAMTAGLCSATGGQPGDVCGEASVQALQSTLARAPVPTRD
jgi:hypothetical protein